MLSTCWGIASTSFLEPVTGSNWRADSSVGLDPGPAGAAAFGANAGLKVTSSATAITLILVSLMRSMAQQMCDQVALRIRIDLVAVAALALNEIIAICLGFDLENLSAS